LTVIEVGIIKSGLPIFIKNFKNEPLKSGDNSFILRSAFLSAIQSNIAVSFTSSNLESFELKFKNHIILITEIESFLIYAVTKESKFLFPIRDAVFRLSKVINFQEIQDYEVSGNKKLLEPKITEIFKDLILSPSERVKRML
jgi:hypothetical protein